MTGDWGWTNDRVETLKKLWADGLSCSQIAKQLRGVSRNAVIGKVHRLGLSGRATPSKPARPVFKAPKQPRVIPAAEPRDVPDLAPTAPLQAPKPARDAQEAPGLATVLTLGPHMCKWPIGDPAEAGFTFCGRRRGEGEGSYCVEHARLAYQPAPTKNRTGNELARSLRRYV